MVSAGALTIFSGKIILNFGTPERLRTLRCSIFTGGVVTENGSCSAAFCESAALREIFCQSAPSQALPRQLPRRGSQAGSPIAKVLSVMRKLPAVLLALPLGELSPQVTERAHAVNPIAKVSDATRNLPSMPEGVRSKLLPVKTGERNVRRRSAPRNSNHISAIDVHSERGAHLKWFYPNSTTA